MGYASTSVPGSHRDPQLGISGQYTVMKEICNTRVSVIVNFSIDKFG